ncbi:MAG: ATP-binding protein [Ktedonobacteraceae bacterium]
MDSTTVPPSSASSPPNDQMKQTTDTQTLFQLLAALADGAPRQQAARQLARYLGADDLLIFLRDAEVGVLLPAPGLVQTLPDRRRWQPFLASCAKEYPTHATLPFPDTTTMTTAVGLTNDNGTVLVLLGGTPRFDEAMLLVTLLPLLEAAFLREKGRQLAEAEATIARKMAAEAQQLITMLDTTRQDVQNELYARTQAEKAFREQVRLAALQMEVSTALTAGGTMQESLERCARALVQHLDAAFARFWTLNETEQMLELQASAGMYTHLDGGHARVPVGTLKIGRIAATHEPHLTNTVLGDPQVSDQEWARREGMVAFAGYPLLVEDRLVGVMALFARHQITETELAAMASVANAMAVGIQRYQTEKEQVVARQKVEESEERFRTLADNMSQFAWTADPTGWIFWYNQRWYDYTGTTPEQMAGWGWQSVQHPEHVQQVTEKIRACFETGEIWEDTFPLRGKDGTYRWFLSRAIPIRDTQGKILRWFGTNTDITEQKDLEHQKEVFVSMATHELKTPLTSLRGYIQLAERQLLRLQRELDSSQTEQQKALDGALLMLSRSQQQLSVQNRLINDMLDISRIQASALELLLAPCDLGSLVRETVQDYQIAHPQRQITLNQPEQEVLLIHADQDRIVQVLSNYLNNALKYSVAGTSINVNIMCKHAEARICVTDQGPGLSPEAQQHIWEQFYRAPGIEVQNNAGASLGLGLSICQGIINSHHGQVGVESTLGQGSRFWFTLPLLPEEA